MGPCENKIGHTLCTKIRQITRSNVPKTKNLEKDFVELSTKTKELGWSDEKDNPRAWMEKTEGQ